MAVLQARDWSGFGDAARQVERLLGRPATQGKRLLVSFGASQWQPAIDMYETPDSLVVVADLAGMRVEDIELTLDKGHLLLRGTRPEPPRREHAQFHVFEISRGEFMRVIHLPAAVDGDGVTATYQDGFLEVVLPKARRSSPTSLKIRTS